MSYRQNFHFIIIIITHTYHEVHYRNKLLCSFYSCYFLSFFIPGRTVALVKKSDKIGFKVISRKHSHEEESWEMCVCDGYINEAVA